MAEEIVTYFRANVDELEEALKKGEKDVGEFETQANASANTVDTLGKASGNAAPKVRLLSAASQSAAKSETELATAGNKAAVSQEQLANSTDKTSGKLNIFQRIGSGISSTFQSLVNGVKGFGSGSKEGFDTAIKGGSQASGVIQSLGGSLTSAVGSTGGLGGAFSALTGPIGIAAAAVTGFIANFSRLDTVGVALDGLKIQFDGILNRLTSFEGFKGLFDPVTQAKDAAAAVFLAKSLDEIEDKQRAVAVGNAEADKQLASLNQKLRDRTLTEQQRLDVADEITSIEVERSKTEEQLLQKRVEQAQLAIELSKSQGIAEEDLSDTQRDALAQAEVDLKTAQARSISLTETVERRRNQIVEGGINERLAAEKKAIADADQARREAAQKEAERIQKLKQTEAIEGQIITVTTQLEDEDLKSGLSEIDIKLLETERNAQRTADNIKKSFDGLRVLAGLQNDAGEATPKASTPEGQAQSQELSAREGNILGQVNTASVEAQNKLMAVEAAKQLKLAKDTADAVQAVINTAQQNELEAIREKYEKLNELVDKNTEDEVDKIRQKGELLVAEQREIIERRQALEENVNPDTKGVDSSDDAFDALFENRAKANEEEINLIREKYEEINEIVDESFDSDGEKQAAHNAATLAMDQELFEAMQEQKLEQDEIEAERQAQAVAIATETSEQMSNLIARAVEDGKVSAEEFGKTLVLILLDTLEKILLIKALEITGILIEKGAESGGLPGAILGAVAGALIVGLLEGAFAALKSQVAGNYQGDPYIEGRPDYSGRDGYLRRLDKGERVVTAKDNDKYWEPLEAMRKGRFDDWMSNEMKPVFSFTPALNADMQLMERVNNYMDGDVGQRMAQSIMFPKYFDRNLVKSNDRQTEELRENNRLLRALVANTSKKERHERSW